MIQIRVRNKIAERLDTTQLVCGNNYTVSFDFDSEWTDNTKTMRVRNGSTYTDVVFSGTSANLPIIEQGLIVEVGVFSGNLRTTTPAILRFAESIRSRNGAPVTPTPSVYEQIMTALNGKGGSLSYANNILKLLSGETVLSQVTIESGAVTFEMRVSGGYLQYRVNSGEWQNAIALSTLLAGYATQSWVEGKGYLTEHQSLAAYRTAAQQDLIHDSTKQDTIADLATIRSGAALGATALQEHQSLAAYRTSAAQDIIDATKADADDIPTKTSQLTNDSGFLTSHQSLANYSTTAQMNAAINAHHDSTKQDVINDLAAIRAGAALGATAIQEHQSLAGYATQAWVGQQGYLTQHQDISGKENTSNKVTSLSSASTDTQYPSAKCVYDIIGNIESLLEGVL